MGSVIRLVVVGAIVAAVAAIALSANLPSDDVVVLLAGLVAALLGAGVLARYQKQRDRAAASLDPQTLHKPNEVMLTTLLGYAALVGCVIALGFLGKALIGQGRIHPGLVLLVSIAGAFEYSRRLLRKRMGDWASMRVRLTTLTPRSLDAVVSIERSVIREPILVQASYTRSESRGEHLRTEVLWRSPSVSVEPRSASDHTEFHVQIAMPADFPEELEPNERRGRTQWHLVIRAAASSNLKFNFNFNSLHVQRSV